MRAESSELRGNPECVFLLAGEKLSETVPLKIRNDLEEIIPGLVWDEFEKSAKERWRDYLPEEESLRVRRPTAEELSSLAWSSLVSESLRGGEKMNELLGRVWDIWDGFQRGDYDLKLYITVAGTMGTGKSVFSRALAGGRPFTSRYSGEEWEDNKELQMFYRLLRICSDPACRQSQSFSAVKEELAQVQGRVQGWFAARKFIQGLMTMIDIPNFDVVQDTHLGQDGVYLETQAELGLANENNIINYRKDNSLRQRLLPPHLRRPIFIYLWAPFEIVKRRILEVRGRDFEAQVPTGYLLALHRNTIQWMLAMSQMGAPTLIVDAGISDFRPGMSDRSPVVEATWSEIDKIRGKII